MTGHTKEPWHYVIGQGVIAIFLGEALIAEINGDDQAAEQDARRIVDCVNALEGMNPAALGALIEAAEEAVRQLKYMDERSPSGTTPAVLARLTAALAALRGGAQ